MEKSFLTGFTPLEMYKVSSINYGNALIRISRKKRFLSLTGFTLLELLIVITLIGILAGIAITRYGPVSESARRAEAYTVLSEIVTAEKRYYLDNNIYTTTIPNLDSFSVAPASDNFTFTVPSTNETTGYALATHKPSKGSLDYWMCLKSGNRGPGSSPSPSCN